MQSAQPFKSLRRFGCGCLVMVILLMVLGGCAVGFGLSHLWAGQADAAGAAVVRLSDVVSERVSDGDGEFVVSEVTFEYSGGEVWLSGTANGQGELQTDDKAVLVVRHPDGSVARWEHEFASTDGTEVLPLAAVDVSGLFEVGVNEVTLRLWDLRRPALSSTAYYLVGRRNDEDVRVTRVKYEPTPGATKTPTPTQTPRVVASPTVVASPAASPNPTVVATETVVASPTVVSRRVPFPTAVPNPTAVASPTAMATVTAVVSPTVTVGLGEQGTVSSGGSQGLLLPFGSVALLLLVGGVVWGRRKKEVPVVLGGWLEGYDSETGEVLPLVPLSGYGAVILRQPLRLVRGDEVVDEDEVKVVARLCVDDSGIGRVIDVEGEEMELGMETRIEVGSLGLDLRSESVGDWALIGPHPLPPLPIMGEGDYN